MTDNKIRNMFESNGEKKETVITGSKVVTAVSLLGAVVNLGLFGYGFYTEKTSLMIVFGMAGLLCAGFALGHAAKMKKKD